jgi:hypothetical protein
MTTMCGIIKPQILIQTTTSPGVMNNTMLHNLGTYLNVKLAYQDKPPTQGSVASDPPSNINVFVVAVYERDIARSYSEYGSIVALQTSMK